MSYSLYKINKCPLINILSTFKNNKQISKLEQMQLVLSIHFFTLILALMQVVETFNELVVHF